MNNIKTAWAHLPNATHIDRVLADVALRPEDSANIIALLQRMIDDIKRSPTPIKFDTQETSND